ncbi:hypothetical protein SAY86_011050 [Trapa natans]|uniref:Uncharacterized protein n=1 Tax=Trapa natans TaxID=22666 RepID=A0AAN7R2E8_TRANT|nr:hypothetical protein SAY86_011050 [Trapa natans]
MMGHAKFFHSSSLLVHERGHEMDIIWASSLSKKHCSTNSTLSSHEMVVTRVGLSTKSSWTEYALTAVFPTLAALHPSGSAVNRCPAASASVGFLPRGQVAKRLPSVFHLITSMWIRWKENRILDDEGPEKASTEELTADRR